jgi:hypothetical protein
MKHLKHIEFKRLGTHIDSPKLQKILLNSFQRVHLVDMFNCVFAGIPSHRSDSTFETIISTRMLKMQIFNDRELQLLNPKICINETWSEDQLHNMREMCLVGTNDIDILCMIQCKCFGSNLSKLSFVGGHFTSATFYTFAAYCNHLVFVSFTRCEICDGGIMCLVGRNSSTLHTFQCVACGRVTIESVLFLADNCGKRILNIRIVECATDFASCIYLLQKCKHLMSLEYTFEDEQSVCISDTVLGNSHVLSDFRVTKRGITYFDLTS